MAQTKEWRELFPAIPNNDDGGQATLTVSTSGASGVVTTTAQLVFIKVEETNGKKFEVKQFMMFQDYLERVKSVRMRATQKNIDTLHAEALEELDTIRAAVRAHYNIDESQEVEEKQTRIA